jgi:hypothetical protein
MNKKEAAQIIAIMQTNYPDEFRNMSDQAMMARVNLWAKMFEEYSYPEVERAVYAHMATDTGRFMPPVGVIKTMLVKISQPDEMTEMEAWACVSAALRNSAYNSAEEFEKLPPVVQRLVGSPSQLREWGQMDSDTVNSVVASNFQRSYKARAKNERDYLALPSSVKSYMAALADGMKMPELPDVVEDPKRINELLRRVAEQ